MQNKFGKSNILKLIFRSLQFIFCCIFFSVTEHRFESCTVFMINKWKFIIANLVKLSLFCQLSLHLACSLRSFFCFMYPINRYCRSFNSIFGPHVENEFGYSLPWFSGFFLNFEVLHFKRQVISILFLKLIFHYSNCETKEFQNLRCRSKITPQSLEKVVFGKLWILEKGVFLWKSRFSRLNIFLIALNKAMGKILWFWRKMFSL